MKKDKQNAKQNAFTEFLLYTAPSGKVKAEAGGQGIECLAGERACPPEDCGGVCGYEDMLAAIRDPKHEQHDEMAEWLGEDF